ncbi:MAG: FtsX-like permease family protein [Christensenellales bacterium]|jgi:putative ABC transport system permease protein
MQKSYRKNVLRTFKSTASRFLAIFSIVALGVGFLAGLMSTTPDMQQSMEAYLDDAGLYDLRIVSSLGLTEEDVAAIAAIDGVGELMPGYSADLLVSLNGGDTVVARAHSLPMDQVEQKQPEGYLNRLTMVEGRLPVKQGECVVETGGNLNGRPPAVGDELTLTEDNENLEDTMACTAFKVVGLVRNSYYFSYEREPASVGSGSVGLVFYTGEENFAYSAYTEVYAALSEAGALDSLEQPYRDLVAQVSDQIEGISDARCQARYDQVKSDAEQALADARQAYSDAKVQADTQLDAAKAQLDEASMQINANQQQLDDAQQTLDEQQQALPGALSAQASQLGQGKAELVAAQAQVDQAGEQLDQVTQLRTMVAAAKSALPGLQATADAASAQLPALREQRDLAQTQLDTLKALAETQDPESEQGQQTAAQIAALEESVNTLDQTISMLQTNIERFDEAKQALADLEAQLPSDEAYAQMQSQYAQAQQQLTAAQAQIAAGEAQLQLAPDIAQLQMNNAQHEIDTGREQLDAAKAQLTDGRAQYELNYKQAQAELTAAQAQINDAQRQIDELELPKWFVLDRGSNVSFQSFRGNVSKVEALSNVFPVFFFLVAALVALTTMTRMVEEERLQIGTMKALGYKNGAIMQKYLLYACAASALGALTGLLIGFKVFPSVIWNAYAVLYYMPAMYTPWRWNLALTSGCVAVICTLVATWSAGRATLRESPAALMLPRAPKAGKRVLLERIGPLWRRLTFSQKVAVRNLLRYKKRFWMTVIGVAGCTALLLTGFGISDSINGIVTKQFGDIFIYDLTITVRHPEAVDEGPLNDVLRGEAFEDFLPVSTEKCTNEVNGGSVETYIMVPEESAGFPRFVDLHARVSRQAIPFSETGVILGEKFAETLGAGVGDTVELTNADGDTGAFTVAGVCENYVNNYVYMSADTYAQGFGQAPTWNTVLAHVADTSQQARDDLSAQLLEQEQVSSVTFVEDSTHMVLNMLSSINAIVVVIVICAGALAFVVLYNLTNINIAERTKEIATLKVLGFFNREISRYVFRENLALSAIGAALGLVMGIALHQYVIRTVEVDAVMFGRTIEPLSYVLALVLTMVFALFVDLVMGRKLKRISMVESMKAPE